MLITSELTNQSAPKALSTCVVCTNDRYIVITQVELFSGSNLDWR